VSRFRVAGLAFAAALLAFLVIGGTTLSAPIARAAACHGPTCVDVNGHSRTAEFVGSGGLLMDETFVGIGIGRAGVATCADCEWALIATCHGASQGGNGCHGVASCPPATRRVLVFLRHIGEPTFTQVGSYCMDSDGPLTVGDLATRVRDVVIERVPAQSVSSQPAAGPVVNLPAVFDTGQPRRLDTRRFTLVGFDVVLDATPTWHWSWGDGSSADSLDPGGSWPDVSVSHTYRQPGPVSVVLQTSWAGTFTVDGIGPFPTGGTPVVQVSSALPLTVRAARATLVTP
jgi:hypothetical protein